MAHGGIMADMLYNALRRKLAAAQAAGDVARMDRIRAMMNLHADESNVQPPQTDDPPALPKDDGVVGWYEGYEGPASVDYQAVEDAVERDE